MRGEAIAQRRRGRVGIVRQQQHRLRSGRRVDVGAVDAGIRHDEAEPVLDDQHARPVPHDAARFPQNDLDQARVLVDLGREALRARRGPDAREIDVAPFRLRDDLLRHHQDVAVRRRERALLAGGDQQAGEIVARPDQRNVAEWR